MIQKSPEEKKEYVRQVDELKASGMHTEKACKQIGVGFHNYYNWRKSDAQKKQRTFPRIIDVTLPPNGKTKKQQPSDDQYVRNLARLIKEVARTL